MKLLAIEKEKSGFIRMIWEKSDGGIHMQGIPPEDSIELHLNAVNSDMESRGLSKMTSQEIQDLKTVVTNIKDKPIGVK